MDPSLLRDRELFKKRALSTPVVEKRTVSSESSTSSSSKKKKAKLEHGGSSGSKQNSVLSTFLHLSRESEKQNESTSSRNAI